MRADLRRELIMIPKYAVTFFIVLSLTASIWGQALAAKQAAAPPRQFDLRKVGAVTPIKQQFLGTCWSHGTMAAIESNLLISGRWKKFGNEEIPALSEYHLDWWNGFNQHLNTDLDDAKKSSTGLKVHFGGDYRVAAAYISRGDGVVAAPRNVDKSVNAKAWFEKAPDLKHADYRRYYVRDIEWFTVGSKLENIDVIKRRLMTEGAMGTAFAVNKGLMSKDWVHYQPEQHPSKPNHAVAIVGWDDEKISGDPDKKSPAPGAWLIKNSWGTKDAKTGKPRAYDGYYWISYHDKVCCRDAEMGAVSFRNVEPMRYRHVYFHDYHGWRDTMKTVAKAFNLFPASAKHDLGAVSFYTTTDNVRYTAKIYRGFDKGELRDLVATKTGEIAVTGFHTVDLDKAVRVEKGERFVVYLEVSAGGQAFDRTSEIPVLLDQPKPAQPIPSIPKGPNGPLVVSKANPGESYYHDGTQWRDLYEHRFQNPAWAVFDRSANFCMKALAVDGR
ncbi:MAG: hypothetical protein EXS16_14830 [Gemmataceae bacterium]|nr:hypothetical protein [Gemmataceae bacterium]